MLTAPRPVERRYSAPASNTPSWARTRARRRRRSRFRTTAFPAERGIAYATAATVGGPLGRACTVTAPSRWRRAFARARKFSRPRTRPIRRRDAAGPDAGVPSARHAPRGCAYGPENRAFSYVSGCSVDMFVSRLPPGGGPPKSPEVGGARRVRPAAFRRAPDVVRIEVFS